MSYLHQNPSIFSLYRVKFCGFVFVEKATKSFKGAYPFVDIPPSRIAEFIEENLTTLIAEGIITLFFDFENFPFDKAVVSERLLTHLRVRNFYGDGNDRQFYIQRYIKLNVQFRKKTEIAYKALFNAQGSLKALVHSTSPIDISKYQSFDVAYNPKPQKPKNKKGKQ